MSKKKNKNKQFYHVQVELGSLPKAAAEKYMDTIREGLKSAHPEAQFIVTKNDISISRLS